MLMLVCPRCGMRFAADPMPDAPRVLRLYLAGEQDSDARILQGLANVTTPRCPGVCRGELAPEGAHGAAD